MKQEEKDLLLKDLCARLPYGVFVYHPEFEQVFCLEEVSLLEYWRFGLADDRRKTLGFEFFRDGMKPYLRPMSSMTEEEQEEFLELVIPVDGGKAVVEEEKVPKYMAWLNEHFFDYNGLIEKGLALEAPEGIYKI